jgi:hypothetical protein
VKARAFATALLALLLVSSSAMAAGDGDCPPGFPGCESAPTKDEAQEPATEVESPAAPFERNWFGLGFQVDALILPSADEACAGGSGYTCFGQGYYAQKPLPGADDAVDGGFKLATMRFVLAYDRALTSHVLVGGRFGYAFHGGPQRPGGPAFEPFDLEARVSYWFGHDPLAHKGLRPFVMAAAGIAEVDASVPVDVYANMASYQAGQQQDFTAWKKTGLGFVALGLGAMYAVTTSSGVVLELKAQETFPTAGTGFGAQLGYAIGL